MATGERPLFIRLSLPAGLEESLEGLAREVLRSQPKNLYKFAADHFEAKLKNRNQVQGFPSDHDLVILRGEQGDVVSEFKEVKNRQQKTTSLEEDPTELESLSGGEGDGHEDGEIDQAALNGEKVLDHNKDQDNKDQDDKDQDEDTVKSAPHDEVGEEGEIDIDLDDPDVEKAATKIQAGFKGHRARKEVKEKHKLKDLELEEKAQDDKGQDHTDPDHKDQDHKDQDHRDPDHKDQDHHQDLGSKKAIEIQMPMQVLADNGDEMELDDNEGEQDDKVADEDEEEEGGDTAVEEVHGVEKEESVADVDEMKEEEEEVVDIDLDDPEVEAAATKIQAGFKGHKARKEVEAKRQQTGNKRDEVDGHEKTEEEPQQQNDDEEEVVDIDLDDPEVAAAATKIQAGFKGHKTRKDMKERKEIGEDKPSVPQDLKTLNSTIEDEIIDIDLNDPEVEKAATKIQAGYKGMSARREVQNDKHTDEVAEKDERVVTESNAEDEEEIDIDLEDPDVEAAATKIQASFKGHKARKDMKDKKLESESQAQLDNDDNGKDEEEIDIDLDDPDVEAAATKIQAGFKGHKARKEIKGKKTAAVTEVDAVDGKDESIDIDLDDPEVEAAATKIQAGFKGHKTRKEMTEAKEKEKDEKENNPEVLVDNHAEGEDIDIDLEDPEVEAAATKIQASFKGHKTRKEMKSKIAEDEDTKGEEGDGNQQGTELHNKDDGDIDIDLEDPEVEAAATKIQAGFKGHKARKEIQNKKDAVAESVEIQDGKDEVHDKDADDIDIDLDDPEVEAAATKIQAGFKGHKARKEVEAKRQQTGEKGDEAEGDEKTEKEPQQHNDAEEEVVDIDLDDPEVAAAATKIQAGFKGHQTRKSMKERKEFGEDVAVVVLDEPDSGVAYTPDEEKKAETTETGTEDSHAAAGGDDDGKPDWLKSLEEPFEPPKETEEEIVDIDLDDPEVERAATKIQAGFKGHQTRKEMREKTNAQVSDDTAVEVPDITAVIAVEVNAVATPEPPRKEWRPDQEAVVDPSDPEVQAAATRIQAGYKGMQARKRCHEMKRVRKITLEDVYGGGDDDEEEEVEQGEEKGNEEATDTVDGSGGGKVAADVGGASTKTKAEPQQQNDDEEVVDIDLDDPEVAAAATKIQAGFKGHKTRKDMKERKELGEDKLHPLDEERDVAATHIQAGYKGMRDRQKVNDIPKKTASADDAVAPAPDVVADKDPRRALSESTNIPADDEEAAATRIQAGFTGMMVRQQLQSDVADSLELEKQMDKPSKEEEAEEADELVIPRDPEHDSAVSLDIAKALLEPEPSTTTLPTRSSIEVAEALLEVEGDSDGPESLTVISEVKKGAALPAPPSESPALDIPREEDPSKEEEDVSAVHVEESGAVPFDANKKPELDAENEEDEDDKGMEAKSGGRAGTAGSERMEEGIVADEVEEKEAVVNSLESSLASSSDFKKQKSLPHDPIKIYHYRGSFSSQKVLLYLHERAIDFTGYHVDLQRNEHLSPWYLEINPRGEVPAMRMGATATVTDSTRIMHHLEASVPVDDHPALVPCTSDTKVYQRHVYFVAMLDQVPLNEISYGLAFHPHFATDPPSPPYDSAANLDAIRHMVERRSVMLRQMAAEDAPEAAAAELKAKAERHENEVLPMLRDADSYRDLLDRTAATLDKMEEQLKSGGGAGGNGWLLGKAFSAVDILLGIILNRLALLGYQSRFWADGRRPALHGFLVRFQSRPHFAKAVTSRGFAGIGGPMIKPDPTPDTKLNLKAC